MANQITFLREMPFGAPLRPTKGYRLDVDLGDGAPPVTFALVRERPGYVVCHARSGRTVSRFSQVPIAPGARVTLPEAKAEVTRLAISCAVELRGRVESVVPVNLEFAA